MIRRDDKDLWRFREAKSINASDRFILMVLVTAGIISILVFADW